MIRKSVEIKVTWIKWPKRHGFGKEKEDGHKAHTCFAS